VVPGGVAAKQKLLAGIFGGPGPSSSAGGGGGGGAAQSSKPGVKKWPKVATDGSAAPVKLSAEDTQAAANKLAALFGGKPKETAQVSKPVQQAKPARSESNVFAKAAPPKSAPPSAKSHEKWVELFSDEYKTPYWYNMTTGESTWVLPQGVTVLTREEAEAQQRNSPSSRAEVINKDFATVQYDFVPSGANPDELHVIAGLTVKVLDQADDGWSTVQTEEEKRRFGLVPTSYLALNT